MSDYSTSAEIYESVDTVTNRKKKQIFLKYLAIACLVSAGNVIFCFNALASYALIGVEVVVLLYVFFARNIAEYVSYFMIFICNCIEFAAFTGEESFYGFKNFRILGVNLGIIMLLPVFLKGIKYVKNPIKIRKGKFDFTQELILINLIAFVVGLLLVLLNDNNINSLGGVIARFLQESYAMLFLPIAFVVAFCLIRNECPNKMFEVGVALQATLWATVFQMLVSLFGGIAGAYGYLATLQGSILNFYIPLLIVYGFFKEDAVFPRATSVVGLIGSILVVSYNANGKVIMLFFICVFIYWWYALKSGSSLVKGFTILAVFVIFVTLPIIISILRKNALFNAKFEEVERLINIFSGNWLNNLNMSARVRVEEIRDVFIEYSKKPWLFITGKGFLGSILDHTGYFSTHIFSADGFVSEAEFSNRIYYSLHEGASYLIMYGGIGILFMIRFIADAVKRLIKNANVPLIIGVYWFILFYGYSFTLSTFGIIALLYGYYWNSEELSTSM